MSAPTGHYPLERRAGEIERLHVQGAAMAPDCAIMLDRIGVGPGWHCLDMGCGPRGITDLLASRVGPNGRVVGLDADAAFVDYARRHAGGTIEFVQGNAYATGLPGGSFDLVHTRFVGSTAGEPEALIREAIRLARPGGIVAMQEPDMATLVCNPPHPAWDALRAALVGAFAAVGSDISLGTAAVCTRAPSRPCRCAVSAISGRRAFRRSNDRLSAVDSGIVARHDHRAQSDDP